MYAYLVGMDRYQLNVDFDVLMALDNMVGKEDMEKLCELVKKYARGQKRGTALSSHLKLTLQSVLGS